MIETIPITNRQAWLEQRLNDVTSTEVAALFGLSPYKTEFELFHEKRDRQIVEVPDNERMKWGRRLETPIAEGVAEDQGWNVQKLDVYMRKPQERIGSSFDFKINSSSDGPGLMEIKNVAELQFKKTWIDLGNGNYEAPEHIELQVQHQMEVADIQWCAIVALVGGNAPKVIYRNRDTTIGASIRYKVEAFWNRVARNEPPSADYSADADFIVQLYSQSNEGEIYDATNDDFLATLVSDYQRTSAELDELEARKKSYKAQILERAGTAERVTAPWGSIALGMTKDSLGTLITPEMVGTYIGARKGYRQFRVTEKRRRHEFPRNRNDDQIRGRCSEGLFRHAR
jgi:putative phage-type endonuclease